MLALWGITPQVSCHALDTARVTVVWSLAVRCFSQWPFVVFLLAHRSVVVIGVRPIPARLLTASGRSRDVRFATLAAHAHTHIYATHIYMAAATPRSLFERDPPSGGRDSLGPASSQPAAYAAHANTYIYATHIYMWPRLCRAHSSHATCLRAGATR